MLQHSAVQIRNIHSARSSTRVLEIYCN